MKAIKREKKLCLSCMEVHDVLTVQLEEFNIYKGVEFKYCASYYYCANSGDYFADEKMMSENNISFYNAYREKRGKI